MGLPSANTKGGAALRGGHCRDFGEDGRPFLRDEGCFVKRVDDFREHETEIQVADVVPR
jgi:hypothetical protein